MPVAFGLGTGAANSRIDIGPWTVPANVTYFAWLYRIGLGGGSLGRAFGRSSGSLDLNVEASSLMAFGDRNGVNYHTFPIIPGGKWVPVSISGDTTVTVAPKIYVSGSLQTLTRVGTGNFWSTTLGSSLSTAIGNRPSDNIRSWDGYIAHFARWNVQLTDDEHLLLAGGTRPDRLRPEALDTYYDLKQLGNSTLNSPGVLYGVSQYGDDPIDRDNRIKVYFLKAAAGGSVTLSINDLSQTQSLDVSNLTQQSTLSIAGLLQEQFMSAADLVQANVLSVSNATQSQSLDNVVLSQATLLSLQSLTQAQLLENITLTQSNVLSIGNLAQSHDIPSIVLEAGIALVIGNVSQTQSLEDITLIQNSYLNIDGLLQNHTLAHVDLNTETLQLIVNDLAQNQDLQSMILSQQSVLDIFSLTQNQTLSTAFFSVFSTPRSRIYAVTAHNRTYAVTAHNRTIIIN